MRLSNEYIHSIISRALEEDCVSNDVSTIATIGDANLNATATLIAKETGTIAGTKVAAHTFRTVDPKAQINTHLQDGAPVEDGEHILNITADARSILTAERTALNLMQRMSGIATLTKQYVTEIAHTKATIVDTRKTAPGLRLLDKYCVATGGGKNHRLTLSDGVLIKDNHIAIMRKLGMTISEIIAHARTKAPHTAKLEIEVETITQATEAIQADADIVMLDNMTISDMQKVVQQNNRKTLLEASGGITLQNVRQVAETGVDLISIGELTHSPPAIDISLELNLN